MVSPPSSNELTSAADPNITPQPLSPSKKRRLDASIPLPQPKFSIPLLSEYSLDDASSITGSTRTGVAPASKKSSRTRSPVKDMTDLRLAEKPIEAMMLKSLDQLTQDVIELFEGAKNAKELRGIVPRSAKQFILADQSPLEPTLMDQTFYDMQSWATEYNAQEWDALIELKTLQKISARSEEAALLNLTEASWNARVHEPLLDTALEPFGNRLTHWDVTRASINKPYLGKHQSGGELQAKMVDFCITLSDPRLQQDVWNRLSRARDSHSINHSSTNPLRSRPIAVSIETKVVDNSVEEAKAQLSVWASSHLKRLRTLSGTSQTHIELNITLPVVQVNGSVWTLLFLIDGEDMVQLVETVTIGDTRSVIGCYQVVAFLRHLGRWALTVFQPWLYENVLDM
ncbi:L-aminoadipate-semialdehyde dehydrogenase [Fusarium albosuccineum]|uniref:L-aminoadipate-semialdehyde dehydrogenase n=1 Tax=Fusarium albosuccineum TaxID=1237068 RepID=A0A8H4PJ36_9HYPO|nr:L-aminoadipate-semialdehyde dehydrogenase [Fusarium albosuccineum]